MTVIDARCHGHGCESKLSYRLTASCANCGWNGQMDVTKGHPKPVMERCPQCDCRRVRGGSFVAESDGSTVSAAGGVEDGPESAHGTAPRPLASTPAANDDDPRDSRNVWVAAATYTSTTLAEVVDDIAALGSRPDQARVRGWGCASVIVEVQREVQR